MDAVAISKRLSYVLRHRPDSIGITLDSGGWVPVASLLEALNQHGFRLSPRELRCVVEANDKQRFAFDDTGLRIRASQGHSVPVSLGYVAADPPPVLYHGTPVRNVSSILARGLNAASRHAVHLSVDAATAHRVGARRGDHVVLCVDAAGMAAAGWQFEQSANGVWLVDAVPAEFISTPDA